MRLRTSSDIEARVPVGSIWSYGNGIHLLKLPGNISETSFILQISQRHTFIATICYGLERSNDIVRCRPEFETPRFDWSRRVLAFGGPILCGKVAILTQTASPQCGSQHQSVLCHMGLVWMVMTRCYGIVSGILFYSVFGFRFAFGDDRSHIGGREDMKSLVCLQYSIGVVDMYPYSILGCRIGPNIGIFLYTISYNCIRCRVIDTYPICFSLSL